MAVEVAPDGALIRPTARLIVVDDAHRVLLFHSSTDAGTSMWFPPGGGLEVGEDHEAAARRELWEETGLSDVCVGPCIWTREHTWRGVVDDVGERWVRSVERYFLVRTGTFEPQPRLIEAAESYMCEEGWWAWWSLATIRQADHETFVPRRLADLLQPLLDGDLPSTPIDANDA